MNCYRLLTVTLILIILRDLLPAPASGEDLETCTHRLSQSTAAIQLWTTVPSRRVFPDDTLPEAIDAEIRVYAAANEFEPFQLIVRPETSTSATVSIGSFGNSIEVQLYQVKTVDITQVSDNLGRTGPYPDPLWPIENGATVSLTGGENSAFWFSVKVPPNTPADDYTTTVSIGAISIPVQLHVFNFTVPQTLHVRSQMNFSHNAVLSAYSVSGTGAEYWMYVDMMKQFFIDHRLTPKSVLWSGGLTGSGGASYINYDCTTGELTDPHGIWGFEQPAARYLDGDGLMSGTFSQPFNGGTGFPSFMGITFKNNDASQDQRPSSFCSTPRTSADWYTADNPNSTYNTKWFNYMADTENYLNNLGYLDKAYYYFANEPQDQADYDAVAWYSQQLKAAAPNLKLMVSEEPRPEIYNHPLYPGAKIDIWLPVLNNFDPAVSGDRERNHGEETWIYFLHGTRPPYFNPITLDHSGIESKLTGWFLWKYRLKGIAYYSMNNWSQNPWTDPMESNHNGDLFMLYPPSENNTPISYGSNNHRLVPSIRFELMRDSLEDYEYLYLLNNGAQPVPETANDSDYQANKIISGLTSYNRNDEFMYNLRRLIGMKIGREIAEIPDIDPPALHPRAQGSPGNYYLNFQDPGGSPAADPLVVDDHTYLKIGWNTYDQQLGYGWYGDMAHVMYQYLSSGPNELQKSILYDDWGRQKTFEFDLPNGSYQVTVSAGWQGKTYSHNYIAIEGVVFIDDEATTPYLVRSAEVRVNDNKLTMAMGLFDKYTMLNYLDIEALSVTPAADFSAAPLSGYAPLDVSFSDESANGPTSYGWDFDNDSTIDATIPAPIHTYTSAGSYTVSLTATNDSGSNTLVKNDYIRVYQRGDIDCDDQLGLSDIILLLQIVAGSSYASSQQCPYLSGDLDNSNHLGLGDAISAIQKVAVEQ